MSRILDNLIVSGTISKVGGTSSQILGADGSLLTAGTGITISGGLISSSTSGASDVTYSEIPSGLLNGINSQYTLVNTPTNTASVLVVLDGIIQYNSIDFTVTGNTITFNTPPAIGSTIFAYYNLISGGGAASATNLSYTSSSTNGIVLSDTGTDATIPLADGTNAGLLKPADFTQLSNLTSNLAGKQNSLGYTPANILNPTFTDSVTVTNAVYANADVGSNPHQLTTKEYVDNAVTAGLHVHTPVRVERHANLPATYVNGGTTPTITAIASNSILTCVGHSLLVDDVIVFTISGNGIIAGETYFVYEVLSSSTFTISPTLNGPAITAFTNGTGLTLTSRANSGVGATLTNSGTQTALVISTITMIVGDRVLIQNQTNGYENGVYTVTNVGSVSTNWVLTRSTDTNKYGANSPSYLGNGDYFFINEGTPGASESYTLTTTGEIVFGTTSLVFTKFSAAPTYTWNAPLSISGQTISISQSGTSTDGYLSLTDWNIFNNKQSTLGGTGFVKSTAGVISYDTNTYVTGTPWTSAGYLTSVGIANLTATGTPSATTYLRGDNTWATVSGGGGGSPGGTVNEIQYNDGAGGFAGAANVEVDTGNLKLVTTAIEPSVPTGGLIFYSKSIAGRVLPKIVGPSGIDTVMQVGLHGNSVFMVSPANTTTAPNVIGGVITTATTISHQQTIASANPWQATRRTRFQTSTTAGNATGARTAYTQWYRGSVSGFGGFWFRAQLGMNINLQGGQKFVGLCASTSALAGDPSALLNMCGMGYDAADLSTGSWSFMYNDGTGTATKVNLGADALRSTTAGYDLVMYMAPGGSELFVRIVNLATNVVVLETSYTTLLPVANTGMAFAAQVRNGAVAAADNIEIAKVYIETDY